MEISDKCSLLLKEESIVVSLNAVLSMESSKHPESHLLESPASLVFFSQNATYTHTSLSRLARVLTLST